MTDFVLEQRNSHKGDMEDFADLICRYALFLKQPLELRMFVTCYLRDGIWNTYTKETLLNTGKLFNEWERAKERCLFEGFFDNGTGNAILQQSPNAMVIDMTFYRTKTIEDLLKSKCTITLTKTALKQIGL